jgi:hypothetical protein
MLQNLCFCNHIFKLKLGSFHLLKPWAVAKNKIAICCQHAFVCFFSFFLKKISIVLGC